MTLLGELPLPPKGKNALLNEVNVSQLRRARHRGHKGKKRGRNLRQGIRYKVLFAFGISNGDNKKEISQESSSAKLPPTQVKL